MGNIYEAIAELVGISDIQGDERSRFVMVADLGDKNRLYALDDDGNAYRVDSLAGVKNNHSWQSSKHADQTIYQKVSRDESADDTATVYPRLVYTSTGHLVQLAV